MSAAKELKHKGFARRLQTAIDGNPQVPAPNFGRLGWLAEKMSEHNIPTSQETVRKWLAGEALPRPRSIHALAIILGVDEAWLAIGNTNPVPVQERKLRNAENDGVVNLVAGMIQICGMQPAFPTADDKRAEDELIHIYAIIRGAQYAFHVTLATDTPQGAVFQVPIKAQNTFVIGVVRTGSLAFSLFEVSPEALAAGKRKNDLILVPATGLKPITTFAGRL